MWPSQNSSSHLGATCALSPGSRHLLPTCSGRNITRPGCLLLSKHNSHLHNLVPALPFLSQWNAHPDSSTIIPFRPSRIHHSPLFTQTAGLLRHSLHLPSLACARTVLSALHTLSMCVSRQLATSSGMCYTPHFTGLFTPKPVFFRQNLQLAAAPSEASVAVPSSCRPRLHTAVAKAPGTE